MDQIMEYTRSIEHQTIDIYQSHDFVFVKRIEDDVHFYRLLNQLEDSIGKNIDFRIVNERISTFSKLTINEMDDCYQKIFNAYQSGNNYKEIIRRKNKIDFFKNMFEVSSKNQDMISMRYYKVIKILQMNIENEGVFVADYTKFIVSDQMF